MANLPSDIIAKIEQLHSLTSAIAETLGVSAELDRGANIEIPIDSDHICGCERQKGASDRRDYLSNLPAHLASSNPKAVYDNRSVVDLMILARGLRGKCVGSELLHDPVWTMLLDLYWSTLNGERVSVSSLCLASGVPESTALRYLTIMSQEGLVSRQPDPLDKRRVFVELSSTAAKDLDDYFSQVKELIDSRRDIGGFSHKSKIDRLVGDR